MTKRRFIESENKTWAYFVPGNIKSGVQTGIYFMGGGGGGCVYLGAGEDVRKNLKRAIEKCSAGSKGKIIMLDYCRELSALLKKVAGQD